MNWIQRFAQGGHHAEPLQPMDLQQARSRGARERLTIVAIGYAESTHVQSRVRCFAQLGHRVFLITEVPSKTGIPGVTELSPSADRQLIASMPYRAVSWIFRNLVRVNPDHVWRTLQFLRYLHRYRPDVVHVHFAYSYYGWIAGMVGCRPLVVTVMGGDILFDEQGSPTAQGKWLTLNLLARADYITSKSNYLTDVLDRLGGFACKADRVLWGIHVAQFRRVDVGALRSRLDIEPRQRVILSPRILQPMYRVHLVVEAMPHVVDRHPEALLLLTEYAADADYRGQIVKRISQLGLQAHVRFCGTVPHDAMPEYYSLAELAVSVPQSDGMPQTLLEAMACETPNLLSKLRRYEEIVQHQTSAYFVDATPEGIAAGINRLLGCPDLRAEIARNALATVRTVADLDSQARLVERRYYELRTAVKRRTLDPLHLVRMVIGFLRQRRARQVLLLGA